jgi:hypothetical protein
MPLYMDIHHISGGVACGEVAEAHKADLQTQGQHDVRYLRYWVDEQEGKVFCLVEAPSAEAAIQFSEGFFVSAEHRLDEFAVSGLSRHRLNWNRYGHS